jgi:serine/threonine-protein kinase
MELVDGRTVQALLREGPLDPQRALRLGREIAEGLAEAHAHGFIHRDLKSSNVMVTPAGRAKILDFGVAKQILPEVKETTLSTPGSVIGTSYAMSPEQAMGLPLDGRSDLFSLGSLLYEMVTGEAPFRAESGQATLARVCSFRQRPASRVGPEVSHEFSDLIDQLLEKDPVDRPAGALEVAEAMDQVLSARTQGAGGNVATSDQRTVVEAPPVDPAPVWSPFKRAADGSSPTAVASKTAQPPQSAPDPQSTIHRVWSVRTWMGIALLLIVAIVAVYMLRAQAVQTTPQALYQEGMTYLDRSDRKGNLDQAIDSFQKVLAQDETHAAAHAALAKAYWLKLQSDSRDRMWLDRAVSMAERAVALDSYLAAAQVSLGLALGSAGRSEEALRHVERALVLDPGNGDAHYAAGRIYETQEKRSEAEASYKKAIETRPHRMYLDELGSLYLRMGRLEDATAVFRRSIQLAPDGFIGYRNLGVAYYMQGDLAASASQFQKALQIRPDATLYANLGTIHFSQGLYQQSVEAFEKALDMPGGSNNYQLWGNLGDAYRWTPDKRPSHDAYLRAIQLVEEQLRSTPGDLTLRSRLTLYLAKRGDLERALAELGRLEKVPDKDASAWFRMAVAYEVCARREQALAALDRALRAGLPIDEVKGDPELLGLRADVRYHRLIAKLARKS